MNWSILFIVGGASSLLSFVLTSALTSYATTAGVLDQPGPRSSHSRPTPRGGGLAILGAATLATALAGILTSLASQDVLTVGLGAWVLALLGWIDDKRGLRAKTRLGIQVLTSAWTIHRLGGLPVLHAGAWVLHLHWIGYLLGTVGLVWSINLFNFMDGIDALASSQAALIFIATGLLLLSKGDDSFGVISCALGMAAIGFLPWNWPRARIFLGDAGSAPIGYLIGSIAIASENKGEVPLLAVVIIGSVFAADATVTLGRRLLRREHLTEAHRNHAYQRLARALRSHGRVSFWAAAETALFACFGAAATLYPGLFLPAAVLSSAVLVATLVFAERRAPMPPPLLSAGSVPTEMLSGDRQAVVDR
jgi:Fuc2NAc and GlcNAc transferase